MSSNPIQFPRPQRPGRAHVLENWMNRYAEQRGVGPNRIRRLLAFELIAAAFAHGAGADGPQMVIKGGVALELRLRLAGRATRDVDAMLRRPASPDEIDRAIRERLAVKLLDGTVHFEVPSSHPIGPTGAVAFKVQVYWGPRVISRIDLEVSALTGDAQDDWDDLPSLNLAGEFGVRDLPAQIPCLSLRFQIAQKIHAVTDPRTTNDRFRDLLDLLLLDDLDEGDSDSRLRSACVTVFDHRGTHAWPPVVVARDGWSGGYRQMAGVMAFPVQDVEQACELVQAMIDRIAAADATT